MAHLLLLVVHDGDDCNWLFISDQGLSPENSAIVSMEQVVSCDSTLHEIAHIDPGMKASRAFKGDNWKIEPED